MSRTENYVENSLTNAEKRLRSIYDNVLPQYESNQQEFLHKPGAIWFVRKDLEAVRFYMTGSREVDGDKTRVSGRGNREGKGRYRHSTFIGRIKQPIVVTLTLCLVIWRRSGFGS